MRTVLVDGDILLYKFGFGGQNTYQFGEKDSVTVVEELEKITPSLDRFLRDVRKTTKCKDMLVCLTAPNCFRYSILPSYKHNRAKNTKPELYQALKDFLLKTYPCKLKPALEADDIMGILATHKPHKYVVASIDKDLKQIPGWHYNWAKDSVPRLVNPEEADMFFYRQCMTGDTTDGFSGIPGVGPKTAEKVLASVTDGNYWAAIMEKYEAKGLDESYALTQARMARILRASDYDFKRNEPILWSPPSETE